MVVVLAEVIESNSIEMADRAARKSKVLSQEELLTFRKKQRKRGIVYLSRVPPRMQPSRIKKILEEYGEVTRVFLRPETEDERNKRKEKANAHGGTIKSGKHFVEGWIEFARKKIAKSVALTLNGTPVGVVGKKRSFFSDTLWNMKYMKKLKWSELSEKYAFEAAVREQKLREHINKATKDTHFYTTRVQQKREIEAIKKRKLEASTSEKGVKKRKGDVAAPPVVENKVIRSFKQRGVVEGGQGLPKGKPTLPVSFLSKVFSNKTG